MSLTLRTTLGCTEAVIDDDGGLKCFYQVADILSGDLRIRFINKEDDCRINYTSKFDFPNFFLYDILK